MKYALIRDGQLDYIKEWEDETPPDLSHKVGATLVWLPVVEEAKPAYDSNRESLERITTLSDTAYTYSWNSVPLSKDERKQLVDDLSAQKTQDGLGDITDRLTLMTRATMLLDAVGQGQIANDDAQLVALRGLGSWWQATLDYATQLKADIDADLDPDITVGWPTQS